MVIVMVVVKELDGEKRLLLLVFMMLVVERTSAWRVKRVKIMTPAPGFELCYIKYVFGSIEFVGQRK